jgi:tricorn protease
MTTPLLSQPTLVGERLVFVCDDDLWSARLDADEPPRRLTTGRTPAQRPLLDPSGRWVVYTAAEEGSTDLYVVPVTGGPVRRLTWIGGQPLAYAFSADGEDVVFGSARPGPFARPAHLFQVPLAGGVPRRLPWGEASGYDATPDGAVVLARHQHDLARWQRYRGGRVGRLWVDGDGSGQFTRLPDLGGNLASPRWVEFQDERRLLFVSDHEGVANVYSSRPNGTQVTAHTHHTEGAVRFPSVSGSRVVYAHQGDLHTVDLASGDRARLSLDPRPQQAATQRHFPAAGAHLRGVAVHPDADTLLLAVRGRTFVGGHWEGPMVQLGARDGVHQRLHAFMADGKHVVWVSDAGGEEHLELCNLQTLAVLPVETDVPVRNPVRILPGPDGRIAVVTLDNRVAVLSLDDADSDGLVRSARVHWLTDARAGEAPRGMAWSPDGRYLVFAAHVARARNQLVLVDLADPDEPLATPLTDGRYPDIAPDFTPCGRYLVFISQRVLDPVRDRIVFGYGFPKGSRPYLITLDATAPSPFTPAPRGFDKPRPPKPATAVTIDVDGIADRLVPFPIAEAAYQRVTALPSGRFLLQRQVVRGVIDTPWKRNGPPPADAQLLLWDPATRETHTVYRALTSYTVDASRKTLAMRIGNRVRVCAADPDKTTRTTLARSAPWKASRQTFWIDVGRVRLALDPRTEWRQMLLEAWRLQRDHYWEADLAGVDWEAVRDRYLALVDRVGTRAELSDLLWCMHGELATSHAYEMAGDHPRHVVRNVGHLAADVAWDDGAWVVRAIHRGEPGRPKVTSPLLAPGLRIACGTRILAVDGVPVEEDRPLESLLVGHAGRPVRVDVQRDGEEPDVVHVEPVANDTPIRYRSWVAEMRQRVHDATDGRVGYVHVPDMGPSGYAAFLRDYLAEADREGLVVDVRYNGGGHVSQLVLGRLMQRRIAFSVSRTRGVNAYPAHTVAGPMVALCNAYAGSDGDIFCRNWKRLGLGPLIGTRTWGGVVGVRPSRRLVDGTLTTQPEFAYWFDAGDGYGVEGHGVDPDIEVVVSPMDHASGRDPQLERAIESVRTALVDAPGTLPDFGPAPRR